MNSRDREVIKRMLGDLEFRRDRAWGSADRRYYVDCINALKNALGENKSTPIDDHFTTLRFHDTENPPAWSSGCGSKGCG